jgi:arsenate reductase (thioredoxin)
MKILVLCTGNSCRSKMAKGLLQSFDSSLTVHSAGTKPAASVNEYAIKVMAEIGITIGLTKPKSVNVYLNEDWDYVITVCGGANEFCPIFYGKVKHRVHIGFDDPSLFKGTPEETLNEFRHVRDKLKIRLFKFYEENIKNG